MTKKQKIISLIPLPNIVLFPGMNLPLHIFEEPCQEMILRCLNTDQEFGVILVQDDVYAEVGTIAKIINFEKLKSGGINILAEGKKRFRMLDLVSEEPYHEAKIELLEDETVEISSGDKQSFKKVKGLSLKILKIFDKVFEESYSKNIKLPQDPSEMLFLMAANLTCSNKDKQTILESMSLRERIEKLTPLLKDELSRLEVLLENKETRNEVLKNGKLKI